MEPTLREVPAGSVNIESQHRHCGTERRGLPSAAPLGRALQRLRDVRRFALLEHARLEIERIAFARHLCGPELRFATPAPRAFVLPRCRIPSRRVPHGTTILIKVEWIFWK